MAHANAMLAMSKLKKIKLSPRITKEKLAQEILTKEKFKPIFEDLKELIISTARGTEHVLRKEIQDVKKELKADIQLTQQAVTEHSKMIKGLESAVGGLKSEMTGMKSEIGGLKSEITEVRSEMHTMEKHLSDKIDDIGKRVDNHETRITSLESDRV